MVRLKAIDALSLHIFQGEDYQSTSRKDLRYAVVEARPLAMSGNRIGFDEILFKPLLRFLYRYVRTGAIIRGVPGLIYSMALLELDFAKSTMRWEMRNGLTRKQVIVRSNLVRAKMTQLVNSV